MAMRKELVWLRRDLRVSDNMSLYNACQSGVVLCVYLLFPDQWTLHRDSPNKLWFWLENLKTLQEQLDKLNIPLITMDVKNHQGVAPALMRLIEQYQCQSLWFNYEYGVNEQCRDDVVEKACVQEGVGCRRFTDQLLFKPGSILNGKNCYFKVFTPFKKMLYRNLDVNRIKPLPSPRKQPESAFGVVDTSMPLNSYTPTAKDIASRWPAGEVNASNRLISFLDERAEDYLQFRDFPAVDGTSSLSPWLTAGVISVRQCFYSAFVANNGELDTGAEGITCWLSELIWREFYQHVLVGFPRVSKGFAFNEMTDQLPWSHNKTMLSAWQQGKTGFPLIDAAMRQLVETGWMHNRLRMVTAMFLSKNLMLDWRLGEQFFMENLIDGDLAANNGGWQWSPSTGTDAAPYFRMFNPVSQSQKFDPDGVFIKKWIPELAKLKGKRLHQPLATDSQDDLFSDYPAAIVDLSISRKEVMSAFKSLSVPRV